MVQPRKEQILNFQTRHSRFFLRTPTAGAFFDLVPRGDVHASTVTDVPGGADVDVGPEVLTVGPFAPTGSDVIRIVPDGAGSFDVSLAATDTTASRLAAAINAVSPGFAFAKEGKLRIVAPTTGDDSSIELIDIFPGSLARIGLVAGTFDGATAPVRGILTRTPNAISGQALAAYYDRLGGCVVMKTADGRDILTEASGAIILSDDGAFAADSILRSLEVPGGVPIFARITAPAASPTDYELRYYARMPMRPEVVTSDSDFALLDGTDSFTVEVTDLGFAAGPIAMTFPSGPTLTRDQVVTRINDLWAAAVNLDTGDGKAFVNCSMTAPFALPATGTQMEVSVDGGTFQVTTVGVGEATVAAFVATFNTDITGATASPATVKGQAVIRFESDNADGATSSLEFRAPAGGKSEIFRQVGIVPGRYRGIFIAEPHGPSEISIRGFGRGSNAELEVAGSAPTLVRMGLAGGASIRADEEGEEAVRYPSLAVGDPLLVSDEPAALLIPEVMEYGEVPRETNSTTSKFSDRSPGPSLVPSQQLLYHDREQLAGRGGAEAGRPVMFDAAGFLPASVVDAIRPDYENLFKQFILGDFSARTVTHLFAPTVTAGSIETPGVGLNPLPEQTTLDLNVDPTNTIASTRQLRVVFDRDGTPFVPFQAREQVAATDGIVGFVFVGDDSGKLTAIRSGSHALYLWDKNTTDAAATTGGGTGAAIPMTSGVAAEGDSSLRVLETLEAVDSEPLSLIRQINGRWLTTVGDGTVSFGDFNGDDAIQQVVAYFLANFPSNGVLHVQMKFGQYDIGIAEGSITGIGTLILEGPADRHTGGGAIINVTDALDPAFDITRLTLKNLRILGTSAMCRILVDGNAAQFTAHDCRFFGTYIHWVNGDFIELNRCVFENDTGTPGNATILIDPDFAWELGDPNIGWALRARDCQFDTGFNQALLRISHQDAGTASGLALVRDILFENCMMNLDTTNNAVGANPGLVELDPNGNDARGASGDGVHVEHIEFRNCRVRANVDGGANSVLLFISPDRWGGDPDVNFMSLGRLTIDGGLWTCPASASTINPVTIMGVGDLTYNDELATIAFPTDFDRGGVHIRNWRFGWDRTANSTSFSYGGSRGDDTERRFLDAIGGGFWNATVFWGAIAIDSPIIKIRDMEVVNPVQMSEAGEFLFRWRELDIDGIDIRYKPTTGGGLLTEPVQRFRYRPRADMSTDGYANIRNVRMEGGGTTVATSEWLDGSVEMAMHLIEPWSQLKLGRMTFDSCTVINFRANAGTRFDGDCLSIDWRPISNIWPGSPANCGDLTIKNCEFEGGFRAVDSLTSDSSNTIGYVRIKDNNFHDFDNTGFLFGFNSSIAWKYLLFDGNRVESCGNGGAVAGVVIRSQQWTNAMPAVVVNNLIANNNNSDGSVQMQLIINGSTPNQHPAVTCLGNMCYGNSAKGEIQMNRTDGGGTLVALNSLNANSAPIAFPVVGMEISHSVTVLSERSYGNAGEMMWNVAELRTP